MEAPPKGFGLGFPWSRGERSAHQAGSEQHIASLYRTHHAQLRAFARRLLGEPDAAEDLVHDVFVALPRALRTYRADGSMSAFLHGMAANLARRHIRSAVRRRAAIEKLSHLSELEPRVHVNAQDGHELARRLTSALDRLSTPQRIAVVLCDIEGYSSDEAASLVGTKAATVRTRLFHARRQLRAVLGAEQ